MAVIKSIRSEQLEQRVYPDEKAALNTIAAEVLPVFAVPNRDVKLRQIHVETIKSFLVSLELQTLLPFVNNASFDQVQLTYPTETNPIELNYSMGNMPINQYFGYDPEQIEVNVIYQGVANDLIKNNEFSVFSLMSCIMKR